MSLFLFGRNHLFVSLLSIVIGLWAFLVLAGRLVSPLYLEGRMIRTLLANNGKLPVEIFEKYFRQDSLYDELIKRLMDRNNIEVMDKFIRLKNDNYKKGLQNRIMMWGTRKIKI